MIRKIFVSAPADEWLTRDEIAVKNAICEKISHAGYTPDTFDNNATTQLKGRGARLSWTPERALQLARECVGAVIIGFPRWTFTNTPTNEDGDNAARTIRMASDYVAYESALIHSLGLPMLVIAHKDIESRVAFHDGFGERVIKYDGVRGGEWVNQIPFKNEFKNWVHSLSKRHDIFLGYCGSSSSTAQKIRSFLEQLDEIKVCDWARNLPANGLILDNLLGAMKNCSIGVFIFSNDDKLAGTEAKKTPPKYAPRDNVIFETGMFMQLRGQKNVLIIREDGAKIPADLGGYVYISLKRAPRNRPETDAEREKRFAPVEEQIKKFIDQYDKGQL